jgi:hypothetical protein
LILRPAEQELGDIRASVRCRGYVSNGDDDLAKLATAFQITVRFHHVVELERPIDDRFERSSPMKM